jgi:hypothetical protein
MSVYVCADGSVETPFRAFDGALWQPSTHPTYPCNGNWCDPTGFAVGDVFFAEVAVTVRASTCFAHRIMTTEKAALLHACAPSVCPPFAVRVACPQFALCSNRADIFKLSAGAFFRCDFDQAAYRELVTRIRQW